MSLFQSDPYPTRCLIRTPPTPQHADSPSLGVSRDMDISVILSIDHLLPGTGGPYAPFKASQIKALQMGLDVRPDCS